MTGKQYSTRFALVALGLTALAAAPAAAQDTAITSVGVVDVESGVVLPNRTVVIRDGRIASIEEGGVAPAGVAVVDGAGRYLIPGLWDMHVHLRHPAAPELLFPQFIANGVTGVRDMASDCDLGQEGTCIEAFLDWREKIEAGELLGPRLMALSSAPLNPPWDYEADQAEADQVADYYAERGNDFLKVYFRMSPGTFEKLMVAAKAHGIEVGGHIPLRITATEASNAGLRSMEHARDVLFDCFPGAAEWRRTAESQNPPMDVMRSMVDDHDPALCDELYRAMIRNDTWYVPTHVTRRMDAYADDPAFRDDPRRKYLPAAAWDSWQRDADNMVSLGPTPEDRRVFRGFYETGLRETGRAHDAGVNIVLGTDAGDTYVFPGSGTHDELGELVKAGLTPAEALAAATIRAAEFLRVTDDHGSVAVGKRADLVLLSANPLEDIANTRRIEAVIFGGRVHDRVDLDRMLTDVEAAVAEASDVGGF